MTAEELELDLWQEVFLARREQCETYRILKGLREFAAQKLKNLKTGVRNDGA